MYTSANKEEPARAMERLTGDNPETFVVDSPWRKGHLYRITGLPNELVEMESWQTEKWTQLISLLKELMKDMILIGSQWCLEPPGTDTLKTDTCRCIDSLKKIINK